MTWCVCVCVRVCVCVCLCLKRGACLRLGRFSFSEALIFVCVRLLFRGRAVRHGEVLSIWWCDRCQREKRWWRRVVKNVQREVGGTWCRRCESGRQQRWDDFNLVSLHCAR